MTEYKFTASIEHTDKTIVKLYKIRYHFFEQLRMVIRLMIGLGLIFTVAAAPAENWIRVILLFVGAWLIVSLDFPSQLQADKSLSQRNGILPKMDYVFLKDTIKVTDRLVDMSKHIKYKSLIKLVVDADYYYLFQSKDSLCMIDKATLSPQKEDAFLRFMAEETGLDWKQERSFFLLNFYDLKEILSGRKKKKLTSLFKKK